MHEDVPLIVCGAPGGGQRFVRPRRPGLSRAGRAVVDVSLRHSHIRYVLCLRRVLANRYAFRTWLVGSGLRVRGRPCERVCRPSSVLALGGATRERVEDGGEDGGPATGRRTAGGGTAYQQLRARPSPRGRPHAAQASNPGRVRPSHSQTIDCATQMYICDKYSYTVIAI